MLLAPCTILLSAELGGAIFEVSILPVPSDFSPPYRIHHFKSENLVKATYPRPSREGTKGRGILSIDIEPIPSPQPSPIKVEGKFGLYTPPASPLLGKIYLPPESDQFRSANSMTIFVK